MAKTKRQSELPILTETVDNVPLDLPILTEVIEGQLDLLSNKQCLQLAESLFPKLETALLNALSSSPETDWQSAMKLVRKELPKLIRNAAKESL
jgi:hypothetical protein